MIMENKEEPLVNPVLDDATLALFSKKANEFLEAQEAWMDEQMKALMPERSLPAAERSRGRDNHQRMAARRGHCHQAEGDGRGADEGRKGYL
jgi:hypothetical protein